MRKTKHGGWSRELKLAVAVSAATLAASTVFGTPTGWANPMMSTGFYAQQVPGTRHVQVTWLDVREKDPQAGTYLRDGKAWALTWKPFEGYKSDLGSGVDSNKVVQACDCNLTIGPHPVQHLPRARPDDAMFGRRTQRVNLDIVANLPEPVAEAPKPKTKPGAQVSVYESMGAARRAALPAGPQGLDCKVECRGDATATLAPEQPKDTSVHKEAKFTSGAWVLEGRYLRPPYNLVLDDYKLTLNGRIVQQWDRFTPSAAMVQAFDLRSNEVRSGTLTVWCNQHPSSQRAVTPVELEGWLKKYDAIVNEKIDKAAKLARMGQDRDNPLFPCAEQILENWDGYQ